MTSEFVLDRLGRNAQRLEIIKKLPPSQLHDPHAAVYVALLLVGANQLDAAKEYIDATDDGKIYPEEKKLLDEVRGNLSMTASSPSRSASPIQPEHVERQH